MLDLLGMNMRIDKYLSLQNPELSRSKIQRLIKSGAVLVNGQKVKVGYVLKEGEAVKIAGDLEPPVSDLVSEVSPLKIVYEDRDCFVIDKPAGMVVHPGEGGSHIKGTVANYVMEKVDSGVGGLMRPGIVHRLDKDTSGLLIIAKTEKAYLSLIDQFKSRKVMKTYLVMVVGDMEHKEGVIEAAIGRSVRDRKKMSVREEKGGKKAISNFKVVDSFEIGSRTITLLEVKIETGRTHQIRVHMSAIGHPVLGDIVYGDKNANKLAKDEFGLNRQFLHAWKLKFNSPDTGKDIECESKLADDLEVFTRSLLS